MDENELRRLLRAQGSTTGQPGRQCPDETRIAAYVEHRLSAADEARVESHLADCDACLEQVTLLVRKPPVAPVLVAPQAMSRARDLVEDRRAIWQAPVWRWAALGATAVLTVFVVGHWGLAPRLPFTPPSATHGLPAPAAIPPVPTANPAVNPTAPAPPVSRAPAPSGPAAAAATPQHAPAPQPSIRKSVGRPLQLELQFPTENATLLAQQLEFRWTEVPSVAYYEVHLVTAEGNVVWIGKVEGTRAQPPEAMSLEAGKKYFVWIRAHLSGGGTVKSAAVSFRVAGR